VRQDRVHDLLGNAPRQEDLGAFERMVRGARVHLVVEVVQHSGHAPRIGILSVAVGVGAHGGFDGTGVLAEAIALGELGEDRPGV